MVFCRRNILPSYHDWHMLVWGWESSRLLQNQISGCSRPDVFFSRHTRGEQGNPHVFSSTFLKLNWVGQKHLCLPHPKKLFWFLCHAGWCAGRSDVLEIFKVLWIYLLKLKLLSELFPHCYFNGYCSEKGTALKQPNLKFTIYLTPRTFWHLCSKMYCGIDINLTFS